MRHPQPLVGKLVVMVVVMLVLVVLALRWF